MKKLLILVGVLTLSGCSSMTGSDVNTENALKLMVLDPIKFQRNYHNPCDNDQQCDAPLVCQASRCEVPPSLMNTPNSNTPKLKFKNGSEEHSLYIEECRDAYTQQRGMMFRKAFADGWGMLFVFDHEKLQSFWMQNCYVGLDMVFIRKDGTVSNVIRNAAPLDDKPRYKSTDRTRFVLELPIGSIDKYNLSTSTVFDVSAY